MPYWKQLRERNEALDLTVYALAALYILGRDFVERLGEQDWSTIETLAKLTRPASEKTREMVRAVYRARAEETTP